MTSEYEHLRASAEDARGIGRALRDAIAELAHAARQLDGSCPSCSEPGCERTRDEH